MGFVIVFLSLFLVTPVAIGLMIYQDKKHRRQILQKEIERNQWQSEISAKAQAIRQQKQEELVIKTNRCNTLEGFLQESEACYHYAVNETRQLERLAKQTKKPGLRIEHIIWESLKIILTSKNEKTIESRAKLIHAKSLDLGFCPIPEHEMRVMATCVYMNQINLLLEKIQNYKTKQPKEKANKKIDEWIERAFKDEMVFHAAFKEFVDKIFK